MQKHTSLVQFFPRSPGVYLMKDEDGVIIYVGKAKNLYSRVSSYFRGTKDRKTGILVQRINTVDYIVTNNEYEALLLENNLIKEHQPRYNINLKDGKSYPMIRITAEEYPRVFRTRRLIQDGSQYYGPYTDIHRVDRYLELIERLFPLRKCRGAVKKRPHPCLYYHIGRCSAPCAGKTTHEEYQAKIAGIHKLLQGNTEELLHELESQMISASAELRFEEAARLRDAMQTVHGLEEEQQVMDTDPDARDYVAFVRKDYSSSFAVFQMRGGKLLSGDVFHSVVFGSESEDLQQFLVQYYDGTRPLPKRLILAHPVDTESFHRYLQGMHDTEVSIEIPESPTGRDGAVLRLALENARSDLEKRIREAGNVPGLEELRDLLGLPRTPLVIEGFDISHLDGKHTVASMVVLQNGIPNPAAYRHFRIKSLDGRIDDFGALREAVARRYTRIINEKLPRPDLVLIDGGIGQVNAASEILNAIGLGEMQVVGLAKRNEEIFLPGNSTPLILPEGSPPLRILQQARDEAHRFATGFNQRARSKDLGLSTLEALPGVGPARARRLLQSFGSIAAVAQAPADAIARSAGVGESQADKILQALRAMSEVQTALKLAIPTDPLRAEQAAEAPDENYGLADSPRPTVRRNTKSDNNP
ncbi:MAG: excinuclease ABC subunit UvrC [Spirochaetia bacterium]